MIDYSKYLGVKFLSGGRNPSKGLDCLGLCALIYRDYGINLPDPLNAFKRMKEGEDVALPALKELGWDKVSTKDLEPLDLLVMRDDLGKANHIGVYLGDKYYITSEDVTGVQVRKLGAIIRTDSLVSCFRPSQEPSFPLQKVEPTKSDNGFRVLLVPEPLSNPANKQEVFPPYVAESCLGDYVPDGWDRSRTLAVVNGKRASLTDKTPNKQVTFLHFPGGIELTAGAAIAISIGLSALSFLVNLLLSPGIEQPRNEEELSAPSFALEGLRNTALEGLPIPVPYGRTVVAGQIIQTSVDIDEYGRQILSMLICQGHGPIQSIGGIDYDADGLTGPAIPDDIKINGDPAKNYRNVKVSTRLGNTDQLPILGADRIINPVDFDRTLLKDETVFFTTETEIDAFDIIITFPKGLINVSPNGNPGARQVDFTITYEELNSGVVNTVNWSVQRERRAQFSAKFTQEVSTRAIYNLSITRTNPDYPETDLDKESQSDLTLIQEIQNDTLSYPGLVLLYVEAIGDDQIPGGTPPTVTSVNEGREVWVWDEQSLTSPFFNRQYSNNRAWCALDMILHPLYGIGAGGGLTLNDIDLQAFQDWADLNDTLESDGRGGTIVRDAFNHVYSNREDGWAALYQMARSGWASPLIVGNTVSISLDKIRPVSAILGMGNSSEVVIKYSSPQTRNNYVQADYRNEEANYDQATAELPSASVRAGTDFPRIETLSLVGVTHPSQAFRMVKFRLNFAENSDAVFQATGGIETIHLIPGDIVQAHQVQVHEKTSGRVISGTTSTVVLDKDVILTASDSLFIQTSSIEEVTPTPGSYSAGDSIPFSPSLSVSPTSGAPYIAGESDTDYDLFEITRIQTREDLTRVFYGRKYVEATYDDEVAYVPESTDFLPDERALADSLLEFGYTEVSILNRDGSIGDAVELYFTKAINTAGVDVYYRSRVDTESWEPWRFALRSYGDEAQLTGVPANQLFEVSCVPVNSVGARTRPEDGVKELIYIRGRVVRPDTPAEDEVCVAQYGDGIAFTAKERTELDVNRYIVTVGGNDGLGCSRFVGIFPASSILLPLYVYGNNRTYIRAISNRGLISEGYVSPTLIPGVPTGRSVVLNADISVGGTWPGTKTDVSVSGGHLLLDTGVTEGTYESGEFLNSPPGSQTAILALSTNTELLQTEVTWETWGVPWESEFYEGKTWIDLFLNGIENLEQFKSWEECGWTWGSDAAKVITWGDGHVDIVRGTRPKIEINLYTGGAFQGWQEFCPGEYTYERVKIRITLYSPCATTWRPEVQDFTVTGLA